MSSRLPAHFQKIIASELNGERLVWAGIPDWRRAFYASLPLLLFAVPWTAFSLFWEYMAVGQWLGAKRGPTMGGFVFALFGVPFVVIGLIMLSAPLWAAREARRTVYALTDQRLMTIVAGPARKVQSVARHCIGPIQRIEQDDGTGTLTVTIGMSRDSEGDVVKDTIALVGIAEVGKVERLLRAA